MKQPVIIQDCVYHAHNGAMIHPDADIGRGSVIHAGAVIGADVRIGWNCVIGPGAKIGQAGFGYEYVPEPDNPDPRWYWRQKPHPFGVIIGDNVDVGANTCIDRGSWRNTVIGAGTKIDNLVHIAHNVITGRDCIVIAHAEISGSCVLRDRAYIAPGAMVRERLTVGEGSIVGLGAVVVKDVPDGMIVVGNPARVMKAVTEWPPPPPEGK